MKRTLQLHHRRGRITPAAWLGAGVLALPLAAQAALALRSGSWADAAVLSVLLVLAGSLVRVGTEGFSRPAAHARFPGRAPVHPKHHGPNR